MTRSIRLISLFLFVSVSPALAQGIRGRTSFDSSAWKPITIYVVEQLAPYISRAAVDSAPQPWVMSFPAAGPELARFAQHLKTILRATDRVFSDSIYYELKISPLRISGDTAFVRIQNGMTQLCKPPSKLGGYGNSEEVFVVRMSIGSFVTWSAAHSKGVTHGDRFDC